MLISRCFGEPAPQYSHLLDTPLGISKSSFFFSGEVVIRLAAITLVCAKARDNKKGKIKKDSHELPTTNSSTASLSVDGGGAPHHHIQAIS